MKPLGRYSWLDQLLYLWCKGWAHKRMFRDPRLLSDAKAFQQYNYQGGQYVLHDFLGYSQLEGLNVLDWGCGDGGKTLYYRCEARAASVCGIDLQEKKLELARQLAEEKGETQWATFVKSDGTNLPFSDASFDIIISNSAFEHVEQGLIATTLRECVRVLKPGGLALLRFHPYRSRWGSHLMLYVPIPWAHHLFPEQILLNVWKELYFKAEAEGHDHEHDPEHVAQAQSIKAIYYLNGITVCQFEQIIRKSGFSILKQRVSNLKITKCLAWGPLKDYFCDHMIYILQPN